MTTLTSIEQILAEGLDPVYIVFALPAWPKHNGSTCENSEFYFCDVSAADDPGVHQYDVHGVYSVPGFPHFAEHDKGEPSE